MSELPASISEASTRHTPALRGECPSPWGEPLARAQLKATPDDFQVVEIMGFEPSGEGEHLWLWVEKCGLNTDAVAADIAQRLGLSRQVVSYSGMKDRHARTQQWFSVHWPAGAGTANAGVCRARTSRPMHAEPLLCSRMAIFHAGIAHDLARKPKTLGNISGNGIGIEATLLHPQPQVLTFAAGLKAHNFHYLKIIRRGF